MQATSSIPVNDVCFVDVNTGWIAGGTTISGNIQSYIIMKTTNSGNNWVTKLSSNNANFQLWSIYFLNSSVGFASGTGGRVLRTTDGGENWNITVLDTTLWLKEISFSDENTGCIVTLDNGKLYRTSDAGNVWSLIQTSFVDYDFYSICFVNSTVGWIAGGGWGSGAGIILKTFDGGLSWFVQRTIPNRILRSISFGDLSTGWATGNRSILLRTSNGGTNWIQYSESGNSSDVNQCIFMFDNMTLWAEGNRTTITHTSTGGQSWSNQYIGPEYLFSVYFPVRYTGWTVGGSKIFKTTTGGEPIGIKPISSEVPDKISLGQNFPNPFNLATKFQFRISRKSFVALVVYDIMGKEIAEIVKQELIQGIYEVEWNGTDLGSGIYFYKLITGDFVETRKMILLK